MFGRLKVTPGGVTIKTTDYDGLPESLRKSIEITKKLYESVSPIIEQQNKLQQIADAATMPKIAISSPAMDTLNGIADNNAIRTLQENSAAMNALAESTRAMQVFAGVGASIEALHNNSTVRALGEIALKSAIPTYQFESPALKAFETWSNSAVADKKDFYHIVASPRILWTAKAAVLLSMTSPIYHTEAYKSTEK